ncbi:MAG: DUF2271 domain-containing protein [Gammaproteobacteria bacterium]
MNNIVIKRLGLLLLLMLLHRSGLANSVDIDVTIPPLDVATYHRPYVAVWLETPQRRGVHTLAIWHEKDDWLKDLRQWWRKLGRNKQTSYDAASGATRRPGHYHIHWDGRDSTGATVEKGDYYLLFEAAREAGGREFIRQKIVLGEDAPQRYELHGNIEFGSILININTR